MANDFKWSAEKVLDHLKNSIRSGEVVVFDDLQKEVALEVLLEFIAHCRGRIRVWENPLKYRHKIYLAG